MGYNEFFHSNIHSFADCVTELKRTVASAIDAANKAYDERSYKGSINDIRAQLEVICWAIICKKASNFEEAKGLIGTNSLANLVNIIASSSRKWFDNDPSKNEAQKELFNSIRDTGNAGSHFGEIKFADCEQAKFNLKKIITWFWAEFLPNESIPSDIQTALEGTLLDPNARAKSAALRRYFEVLKQYYEGIVLNDEKGMTLQNIYIEPCFKLWEGCLPKTQESESQRTSRETFKPISVDKLHDLANVFFRGQYSASLGNELATHAANARLLLLLGQPGQGKTSFCKRFLHEHIQPEKLAENGIFYIRLRDIESVKDLFNNPLATLEQHVRRELDYQEDFLDRAVFYKSLIILDGLDELAMRDGSQKNEVEDFCKELLKVQEKHPHLRFIITSRYGQVDLDKFSRHHILVAAIDKLSVAQQLEWLAKYKAFHPEFSWTEATIQAINQRAFGQHTHLSELIDQPILLHLIAVANIELEGEVNRAAIYDRLFDHLIARAWDKGQIAKLRDLEASDLREYIRELAFAIYVSDYEYIRQADLEKLPASKTFLEALGGQASMDNVLRYLMMAFYMQEVRKDPADRADSDKRGYAVEFLHKSLQEYLVAEKIWEDLKEFSYKLKNKKYSIESLEEALDLAWKLFSLKTLSSEIDNYLQQHIDNDSETDKGKVYERMLHFMPELLEKQFLLKIEPKEPLSAALRTFQGYWNVLQDLKEDEDTLHFDEAPRTQFLLMLKISLTTSIYIKNMKNIDLSEGDLSEANLSRANLSGANLSEANLTFSYLNDSNLTEVNLNRANLNRANLSGANLSGANLSGANLSGANLSGANLHIANLNRANLNRANLSGANLSRANSNRANLSGANLNRANLSDANLNNCKFNYSNLIGADLNRANLSSADLMGVNLSYVNLSGANLSEADLSRANLSSTDLKHAHLMQANLREANLTGIKNIDIEELKNVKSLYGVKGLSPDFEQELRGEGFGYLFLPFDNVLLEDEDLPF